MTTDRTTVLDPADSNYVLPLPLAPDSNRPGSQRREAPAEATEPEGHGDVIVVSGAQARTAGLLRGQAVARALGERSKVQANSLQLFLTEVQERIEQLDAAIAEDSRAQLKGALRELGSVVDWCGAVRSELAYEANQALQGHEPIEIGAVCQDLANAEHPGVGPITVVFEREVTWWGNAAALVHLLQQALAVVSERTHGIGSRIVELKNEQGVPTIAVRSRGEPVDGVDPAMVARLRGAAEQLGATIGPDALGCGVAGMVLRLPV